jgi:hypothetical protein
MTTSSSKSSSADHVKKTLAAMKKSKGGRYMGSKTDDFLINMEFRNQLPPVPCGPFLKKVTGYHKLSQFGVYRESSLEKNYVWQRHCPPDMNITVHLEDQESVLGLLGGDRKRPTENYYLEKTTDKSKQQQKQENAAAHWWLRETKYGENQLFKDSNKKSITIANEEVTHNYYDQSFIEDSFAQITDQEDSDEVEWSIPITPDDSFGEQAFSYTRFDEDPEEVQTWEQKIGDDEQQKHVLGGKRMCDSILTNIRDTKKGKGYAVSMVVPPINEDDSSEPEKYTWASDYAMNLNTSSARSNYLFLVDDKAAQYHHIGAFVDMHRLNLDEIKPHDVDVNKVNE